MESDQWELVKQVFAAAGELPAGEQPAYLDQACGGDAEVRAEVESLLAAAQPTSAATVNSVAATTASHGDDNSRVTIGPYKLLQLIGEGGMGEVWQAEQAHPIRRTVALKLIKLGMDSRAVIARFEQERQALAMMNHPNVARVFDAGTSDSGRPFFVMEFVAGKPITSFCDDHHFSTRQRLKLFTQACDAVQHAHQKAIIHRDLKPSNILVAVQDGQPIVKVIDFGVAKATAQKLTERTLFTEHGQLIGTPEYMSPEQAELTSMDIDTRSDVYSLGVVLYELLSGALPFDPKSLRQAAYNEIQRIIREVDPPRPSTRLSSLGEGAAEVARRRSTQLNDLSKQLRSELEWIPLKAMRKDRAQRYHTADQLADDIRNYLAGRALLAGPESRTYRARKFLRRHARGVAASAAMVLILIAGTATYIHGIRGEQRRTAEERRRAEVALVEARHERDNAKATLEFLTNSVLAGATPEKLPDAKLRDQIVDAMITPAAQSVGEAFKDRPLIEASVRDTIVTVLDKIGRSDLALPHALASLALRRSVVGDGHPDTIESWSNAAIVLHSLGRGVEAEPLFKAALEHSRRALGEDHPDTIASLNNYASVLTALNRAADAEPLYRLSWEGSRRTLGDGHPDTLSSLNNYAHILNTLGRSAEAEPLLKQAWESRRQLLGADHPATIVSLNNYALVLNTMKRWDEAEPLLREALEQRRRVLGSNHRDTIRSLNNHAHVLQSLNRLDEAEMLHRQAVDRALRVATLGPGHHETAAYAAGHAKCLDGLGRHDEAAVLRRQFALPSPATQAVINPSTGPATRNSAVP
jgi:non-specific serine/threonine protein kinase/serine/threonine-protein kinase